MFATIRRLLGLTARTPAPAALAPPEPTREVATSPRPAAESAPAVATVSAPQAIAQLFHDSTLTQNSTPAATTVEPDSPASTSHAAAARLQTPRSAEVDTSVSGLTDELRTRIAGLATHHCDPDVTLLLNGIAAEPTASIRQLPAAAQRALALTQLSEPPMAELIAVFEEDPTLAQALLTQANSSFYGASRAVLSVRDALQRLGVSAARNVLMAHSVSALLCRPGGAYAQMVDDVWQHMVRTAPIARRIASAFNADPEEAFGLALLHDVGKLVVFDQLTALRLEKRREIVIPPESLRDILAELHEPLGGLAVHNWNLGDAAAAAVATHHRNPVPVVRDALSEVLHVAEAADISAVRGREFDLAESWERASLGGSAVRVERALLAA